MTVVTNQTHDNLPTDFGFACVGAHITVATGDLATKYTATKPATATALLAQNTGTTAMRFTLDGTDPEAAVGFQLPASMPAPVLIPCPGAAIEIIRESAGAALAAQWVK